MTDVIAAKIYTKCRIQSKDEIQFGESNNGTPEMILPVFVPELNKTISTIIYLSRDAAWFGYERLKETGWTGTSAADLATLDGVGTKEFAFEVRYETYDSPDGKKQVMKTQIFTGGGRITTSNPLDRKTFAAKVAALTGSKPPSGAAPPPFG